MSGQQPSMAAFLEHGPWSGLTPQAWGMVREMVTDYGALAVEWCNRDDLLVGMRHNDWDLDFTLRLVREPHGTLKLHEQDEAAMMAVLGHAWGCYGALPRGVVTDEG